MSSKESEIEREKYKLIQKVAYLEEEMAKRDTMHKRMSMKIKECSEKFQKYDQKLLSYQKEVKQANKNIIYLIKHFIGSINKISKGSIDTLKGCQKLI